MRFALLLLLICGVCVVLQVRKVTARSEEEAAEADMRAAKMQVEATDEAEAKKKQLAD